MKYTIKNNGMSNYQYKDRHVTIKINPYSDQVIEVPEASVEKFEKDIKQSKYSAINVFPIVESPAPVIDNKSSDKDNKNTENIQSEPLSVKSNATAAVRTGRKR